MPPVSVTPLVELDKFENDTHLKKLKVSDKLSELSINDFNSKTQELNIYEEVRVQPSESKLLVYARKWEKWMAFETPLIWTNIIFISIFHIISVFSFFYLIIHGNMKWESVAFFFVTGLMAGFGVTAGVHRYWCHRSYKAKMPLQIILMLCYSVAGQNDIYQWVRDHRIHHKFSETSADPHNACRGLFFSHVGWLMMKKHPRVIQEGNKTDMSDISNDPLVQFHTKYFTWFKLACCFVLPSLIPVYFWNESWVTAILFQAIVRYMFTLNFTWSVNSFAHAWGHKPYDRHIVSAENWLVSMVTIGEGWHNYHHTFPWDYKASELAYTINFTTVVLDCFATIGWAYDMKEASPSLVKTVAMNRGEKLQ